MRQVNKYGKIHVALVMGKSRVTPLKATTIPRLELTAGTVSAKVAHMIREQLSLKSISDYYWTDSQIVLGYILNETRRFKIFVANRIQQIREFTEKEKWRYVETDKNPSDAASRGLTMENESEVHLWLNGPEYLWHQEETWAVNIPNTKVLEDDPEVQSTTYINTITIPREQ